MNYKNLVIIGTSHIAKQSVEEVSTVISKRRPSIVALELDKKRLGSLLSKAKGTRLRLKDILKIGIKGYLFLKIGGWAERKLGKLVGVMPGTEMMTAYKIARKNRIKVYLIDQDIEITLKRLSKSITWREKFRFLGEIIKAVIFRDQTYQFDLTKVPPKKIIKKLIKEVKDKYPNVYNVLIKERNYVLAKNLYNLMRKNKEEIVAVIGAGHEEEIVALIRKYEQHQIEEVGYRFSVSV